MGNIGKYPWWISIVKASKIQMLLSQFEEIRIEEEETFDEFYFKHSTTRNSTINLGKKITDAKIIKRILRSLSARFIPQIAAIIQSQDLENMRVKELVGSFQTFELLLPNFIYLAIHILNLVCSEQICSLTVFIHRFGVIEISLDCKNFCLCVCVCVCVYSNMTYLRHLWTIRKNWFKVCFWSVATFYSSMKISSFMSGSQKLIISTHI